MASSKDSPLSKTEHIAFTIAFTLVALTIIVGNSLTIAAFTKTRLIRRPTHYFLISLAVADLIVGAFAMPLYITHFVAPFFWKKSQIIQTLYYTIDIISGMASVFTLAVVSVERLYAFGWPWRYRNSSSLKCYIAGVAFTWLSAAVISCLYLGLRFNIISEVVHTITVVAISVSLAVACSAYSALGLRIKLRKRRRRGMERHKRLSLTLFAITGIFILTWTPFEVIIIIIHFCNTCAVPPLRVGYVIKLLQYSNSFMNTLVYSLRIQEFRRAIINFLRCGSLTPRSEIQVRNVAVSVNNLVNSCSAITMNALFSGTRLAENNNGGGHRRLAKRRTDLFLMHRRGKYSPSKARATDSEKVSVVGKSKDVHC